MHFLLLGDNRPMNLVKFNAFSMSYIHLALVMLPEMALVLSQSPAMAGQTSVYSHFLPFDFLYK